MAYVAGVDHERGLCGQCTNCADRLLECAAHVRIGWLVEADMAVNVLQEGKPTDVLRERLANEAERFWDAAFDRPGRPFRPDHAFENFATV
jgi:hypothetical protein